MGQSLSQGRFCDGRACFRSGGVCSSGARALFLSTDADDDRGAPIQEGAATGFGRPVEPAAEVPGEVARYFTAWRQRIGARI